MRAGNVRFWPVAARSRGKGWSGGPVWICCPANSAGGTRILHLMKTSLQATAVLLSAALVCTPALLWSQQPYPGQEDHRPKQEMKDAGHAVKHGTQKAYHSTKRHTKRAARKTRDTVRGGVDGAREGARQPE